jgi:hypothetical protein
MLLLAKGRRRNSHLISVCLTVLRTYLIYINLPTDTVTLTARHIPHTSACVVSLSLYVYHAAAGAAVGGQRMVEKRRGILTYGSLHYYISYYQQPTTTTTTLLPLALARNLPLPLPPLRNEPLLLFLGRPPTTQHLPGICSRITREGATPRSHHVFDCESSLSLARPPCVRCARRG